MQRYRARVSGPLLDRIDLHVEVPKVPHRVLTEQHAQPSGPTSAELRDRVQKARARQLARADKLNHLLTAPEVQQWCTPDRAGAALLEQAVERLGLSARAYHRILKVARTIADLSETERIDANHVGEAIAYRRLDRAPAALPHS